MNSDAPKPADFPSHRAELPASFSPWGVFPEVDYAQWRCFVDADLKGASFDKKLTSSTYDGISIQPLYVGSDAVGSEAIDASRAGRPGQFPFVSAFPASKGFAAGLTLQQTHAHPDLQATRHALFQDVSQGVEHVLLRFDAAARAGRDPDDGTASQLAAVDGIAVYNVDDLAAALGDVSLDRIEVALQAGSAFFPAAAALAALWRRCGIDESQARGQFGADPLGALATQGRWPASPDCMWEMFAELTTQSQARYPNVKTVCVDTSVYHEAGASTSQDIAFAAATGVEYLRELTQRGVMLDHAARQCTFRASLGVHFFLAIAKLRAMRRVWSRITEASGIAEGAGAMTLHAQLSRRVLTRRAPQLNLLRNATSLFAASVGGAQSAASVPWDEMLGPPSEQSRRIARNTAFVLLEEGALARVADPGGGSYFVERLTSQFAQRAWETFQEIESKGGMFAVLQSGWCAEQVAAVAARRAADAARRKPGITGVSEFALLDEDLAACDPVDRTSLARLAVERVAARRADETVPSGFGEFGQRWEATVRAAEQGATLGLLALRLGMHQGETSVPSFPLRRLAEPFEALRDWSDASTVARGRRPCVYLANFGAPAEFLARATFARNFFAAGGCSAIEGSGATSGVDAANAYDASAAPVAVLCGTDAHYELFARDASRLLKERGASQVVLAGRPGDQEASFRAAGIDHFIYLGCNVLETLELLLGPEGAFAT